MTLFYTNEIEFALLEEGKNIPRHDKFYSVRNTIQSRQSTVHDSVQNNSKWIIYVSVHE